MSTTAADILVVAFSALAPDEQREVVERITEVRARREAGELSDTARFIRRCASSLTMSGTHRLLTSTARRAMSCAQSARTSRASHA